MNEETARIIAVVEANRLGLRYFWGLGGVILVLGAAQFAGLLSDSGTGLWAGLAVLLFFAAGLFFTYALSAPLYGSPWLWCLASLALCFTGFGPVLLVAYLTYQAQQELLKVGLDPGAWGVPVDDLAKWAARREGGFQPL
jgi:hypothetical protein